MKVRTNININCQPSPQIPWSNAVEAGVPANALLDENGDPLLDEFGGYLLEE